MPPMSMSDYLSDGVSLMIADAKSVIFTSQSQ